MKGMVFTEFLEMVESAFGFETVDRMIEAANVPSGGVYTSTGTYDHAELVSMVVALSGLTGKPVPELVFAYGKHLFTRLAASFPQYVPKGIGAFTFLQSIDSYIHVEVRKIYPDAELPRFESRLLDGGRTLEMDYSSPRHFDALAHGLLEGAIEHFGESATIERTGIPGMDKGSRFTIRKAA